MANFDPSSARAGPPFITDAPEPVDYRHWEFYIASQYAYNGYVEEGTLPHLEHNYGAVPDLQLHLLIPLAFFHPNGGPTMYGIGDTEAGVKYRFTHESDTTPQIGCFPLLHLPTGGSDRGLGAGHVKLFLPIWAQKDCKHGRLMAEAVIGSIPAGATKTSGSWAGYGNAISPGPSPWGVKSSFLAKRRSTGATGPAITPAAFSA